MYKRQVRKLRPLRLLSYQNVVMKISIVQKLLRMHRVLTIVLTLEVDKPKRRGGLFKILHMYHAVVHSEIEFKKIKKITESETEKKYVFSASCKTVERIDV